MLTGLEPKTNIPVPVNTQRAAVEGQLLQMTPNAKPKYRRTVIFGRETGEFSREWGVLRLSRQEKREVVENDYNLHDSTNVV
jgi:hypothetical protein